MKDLQNTELVEVQNGQAFVSLDTMVKFSENTEKTIRNVVAKNIERLESLIETESLPEQQALVKKTLSFPRHRSGARKGKLDWSKIKFNRDQAAFLVTLMDNTEPVVEFKYNLIKQFSNVEKNLIAAKEAGYKEAMLEVADKIKAKYETKLLEAQKKSKYKYIMYDDGTTSINGCAERLGLNETDLMNVVTWKQWQGTKFKFTIQRYLKDEIKGIVGSEKERGLPTYYPDIIKRAYDQWIEAGKPIITEEEQIRADKIKFLTKELKRLTNER